MFTRTRSLALVALLWISAAIAAPTASAQVTLNDCGLINAPGNYVLARNLTHAGTCFTITADGVALDLRNHKITGNGTGSGITDLGIVVTNVIIANGTITGFNHGIYFYANTGGANQSRYITLDKINVLNSSNDGIYIRGCCNTISNTKSNNNASDGIDIRDCCNTLSKVETKTNGNGGIYISECCNFVMNSNASNNHYGIESPKCCSVVNATTASGNTAGSGIDLEDGWSSVIATNTMNNHQDGVRLDGQCNMVTGAKSNGNGGQGFNLVNGHNNIISNSQARTNGIGVYIQCPGNISKLTATGNHTMPVHYDPGGCTEMGNAIH